MGRVASHGDDLALFRQKRREIRERYEERNPEKIAAQRQAQRIPLASQCKQCGGTETLHRHHPDYSKPLEIVTLCSGCHGRAHLDV
jgi:hypothetical protein